ncbi:FAD-dependent oxidoreductase [Streptomyces abyssalis]|uniref:Pyridine nucleotide-disulfide oxidoreductase domain-containing protein 2 n=1 Tax=Streptomyces abyssalis TaxID=933944 RepID=A0A1E7JU03_9ACTN|nr:NAD(P)/FAD-dependent oxidoreductase [Streptomyces abyssalis]OEU88899.1 FAD-dependent oxidoreductase [Streptomyces abyssalis]OEU93442.1 FAD-dependent oxidoreductase [Streptomyces abyssalis]
MPAASHHASHETSHDSAAHDAVIVGGGHNGLVAAAYLARAGQRVLVLERLDRTGGAAVSEQTFAGVDARLSRYSYLVSLLPQRIIDDLGVRFAVRKRGVSSYTPAVRDGRATGLFVGDGTARTRESFARLTGGEREFEAWERFYGMTQRVAQRVFPTLTEPLPTRAELKARIGEDAAWEALFERPLGETIEERFADDLVRGVVLTDGLIGTFSHAHDASLLQNRCFLYHVVGGGTGDWDVPVGGMGALTDALADAARAAGAEIRTGHTVHRVETDGATADVHYRTADGEGTAAARRVLVNASPQALSQMLGEDTGPGNVSGNGGRPGPVSGSQLKVNMLLRRLPRLKDASVDAREAFAGTFHVAEGYEQLAEAHRQAEAGELPRVPPSELYCHSLTDPTILGAELAAGGYQTLTLFGLLTPAGCFEAADSSGRAALRQKALDRTLAELDRHLAEPVADCLALDADGRPCIEAKTPLDLEGELRLPGGHIFHGDLSFPWTDEDGGRRWGVETAHPNVLLCGAGSVRGGGVSGIGGHNAAMAVLEADDRHGAGPAR